MAVKCVGVVCASVSAQYLPPPSPPSSPQMECEMLNEVPVEWSFGKAVLISMALALSQCRLSSGQTWRRPVQAECWAWQGLLGHFLRHVECWEESSHQPQFPLN